MRLHSALIIPAVLSGCHPQRRPLTLADLDHTPLQASPPVEAAPPPGAACPWERIEGAWFEGRWLVLNDMSYDGQTATGLHRLERTLTNCGYESAVGAARNWSLAVHTWQGPRSTVTSPSAGERVAGAAAVAGLATLAAAAGAKPPKNLRLDPAERHVDWSPETGREELDVAQKQLIEALRAEAPPP